MLISNICISPENNFEKKTYAIFILSKLMGKIAEWDTTANTDLIQYYSRTKRVFEVSMILTYHS